MEVVLLIIIGVVLAMVLRPRPKPEIVYIQTMPSDPDASTGMGCLSSIGFIIITIMLIILLTTVPG